MWTLVILLICNLWGVNHLLEVGGDPKVKIGVTHPDIFCTKSAVLNNFLKGHHVESFLKYFLCGLKCSRQKIWSKIGRPLGIDAVKVA